MGDKPKDKYSPGLDKVLNLAKNFLGRNEIDEYAAVKFLYGRGAMAGANLLCDLARVPNQHRQHFIDGMSEKLIYIWMLSLQNIKTWSPQEARAFSDLENGLRTALRGARALPAEKLKRLEESAPPPAPECWLEVLWYMVFACTFVSGKATLTKRGSAPRRGRPRDASTQADYVFRRLIEEIARTAKKSGGKLTLTRATETGTWIDALNKLRRHAPPGRVIPKRLNLSLIEKIQGAVNSGDDLPF
jgi:hypothetical protein